MTPRRIPGMVVVTALLSLATADGAGAQTYCVSNGGMGPPSCPLGADTTKTFPQALTDAAASTTTADTILLAPGTFTDQTGTDFTFDSAGNVANDLTIQGAGTGLTTLTQNPAANSSPILSFPQASSFADQDVSDLTVSMPPGFASSGIFQPTGAHRVNVIAQGATTGIALRLSNRGSFDHMDVELPLTGGGSAFYQPNISVTIADSTIVADQLMAPGANASDDILRNLRMHAGSTGFQVTLNNAGASDAMTLDNVQIQIDSMSPALAIFAGSAAARVNASHVTITGNGSATSQGVLASTSSSPSSTINLANSIITNVGHPLVVSHSLGVATINVTNSVLSNNAFVNSGGTGSGATNTTASVAIADPHLVDVGGLLYPRFDSPAIDRGDPAKTTVTTDLVGQPRAVDGNGDGTAPPDAGVIEYQRRPPTATATAVGPFVLGTPTAFQGTADDLDPGDSVTTAWAFSDGTAATALAPAHTFDLAGPFTATLTATDSAGLTATAQATGTIAPRPPATSTSTLPVTPPPTDTTKPVVSGARFDPKTFRASSANTATSAAAKKKKKAKRPPAGSKLRLSLSEAASATITVAARHSGRLTESGKTSTCRAKSKANRKGRSCTYYTTKATLKRAGLAQGANAIAFTGRIGNHALAAGAYRGTITPKDAAGNTGTAVAATFTIAH